MAVTNSRGRERQRTGKFPFSHWLVASVDQLAYGAGSRFLAPNDVTVLEQRNEDRPADRAAEHRRHQEHRVRSGRDAADERSHEYLDVARYQVGEMGDTDPEGNENDEEGADTVGFGGLNELGQQSHEPSDEDRADQQHPRRVCGDELREADERGRLYHAERRADHGGESGERRAAEEIAETDEPHSRPSPRRELRRSSTGSIASVVCSVNSSERPKTTNTYPEV